MDITHLPILFYPSMDNYPKGLWLSWTFNFWLSCCHYCIYKAKEVSVNFNRLSTLLHGYKFTAEKFNLLLVFHDSDPYLVKMAFWIFQVSLTPFSAL